MKKLIDLKPRDKVYFVIGSNIYESEIEIITKTTVRTHDHTFRYGELDYTRRNMEMEYNYVGGNTRIHYINRKEAINAAIKNQRKALKKHKEAIARSIDLYDREYDKLVELQKDYYLETVTV